MATWNTDKPAVGNEISADIPDIEENFQELHDVIAAITNGTLGTTAAASFAVDSLADGTTGFASTTTQPFYQNSAPTGWTRNAALTNNSMFCYAATGNPATGGSVDPQSTHTHAYTEVVNHVHECTTYLSGSATDTGFLQGINASGDTIPTANPTGGVASGTTVANTAPYYIEMILAAVD
jgi:hypothetical protein